MTDEPPPQPICGLIEMRTEGWIYVCAWPQGHTRGQVYKHGFRWMPDPESDPATRPPLQEPDSGTDPLPRREPGAELPKVPLNPLNEPNVTRFPRRGRRAEKPEGPVSQPLGDPDRHRRLLKGGGDWQPERPADREPEPEGGPIPPGVEGQSLGTRNKPNPDTPTKSGGIDMAGTVAELVAAAGGINAQVAEQQAKLHEVVTMLGQLQQQAHGTFEGTGNEAVNAGIASMGSAVVSIEDAIQTLNNTIEQFQAYVAAL